MARPHRLIALTALIASTPALAEERAVRVEIASSRLDDAVRSLARQSGASIGFRDQALAGLRVRPVRGVMTTGAALSRMLKDSRLRVVRVAPQTYLVEPAPVERRAVPPAPVRQRPVLARWQDDRPVPIGEIVVTGTKRDIPLSAYPGGVQIIDGSRISAAEGARGSGAIEARLASVSSTHLGNGRNKLFIRGIADSSFVGPTQATVGQYWGNSRITYSAPDPSLRLYDVGRVEVLEGPQGTLYGAGSLGGVVRVVPRAPDLSQTGGGAWGGVQAVQHGATGFDGGAMVNIPLQQDRLALRAVGFGVRDRGYIDDSERKLADINKVTTYGGRASLRFDAGDGLVLDATLLGQKIKGEDSQYAQRDLGGLTRASAIAQPYRNGFWLGEVVVHKQWGDVELTSSLGFARQHVFERFEGPELANTMNPAIAPEKSALPTAFTQSNRIEMLTSETRLSRRGRDGTGWLLGISLLRNKARVNREMGFATFGQPLTGVRNKASEATLFGEVAIEPVERLILTAGGRLTSSRLSGSAQDVDLAIARLDPAAGATRKETRFLPSVALAWRGNERLTLFLRYQQGFRPGGVAVRREFIQNFKGDRVESSEAGLRYRGGSVDIDLTGSHTRWRHIQADLIDGFGFPTTLNIGDGRVLSAGVAARWRPVEGLELDSSWYVNDTKVTQRSDLALGIAIAQAALDGGQNRDLTGLADFRRLPNIANVTGRVGFGWTRALSNRLDLEVTGYARYTGKSTLGIGPILGQLQGDYVDTGLEVRLGNAGQRFSLALTNLFDARGNRFALGSPFLVRDRNQITPLQPRSLRVGYEVSF